MKKIISLLLALSCIFMLASCNEEEHPDAKFFDTVNATEATRIKTLTTYVIGEEDPLNGTYETTVNDGGFVFVYSFERYATLEDAENPDVVIDGNVATEAGKVYYENGRYSLDNKNWFSEAPAPLASQIKLNITPDAIGEYEMNDAKTTLTATVSAETAKAIFGVALAAEGDISISISTNGSYLTRVSIAYSTANADITINTSYS